MAYWYTGINRNTQEATAGKQGEAVIAADRSLIDRKVLCPLNGECYR